MKHTITIATYNRLSLTKRSIASLYETLDTSIFDLIIIDNASTDGTIDYLKDLVNRKGNARAFSLSSNVGVAKAHNFGISKSDNDSIWIKMDNDCEHLTKDWLTKIESVFNADPTIGVICVKGGHEAYMGDNLLHPTLPLHMYPVGTGICLAIRPEVHKAIGYFDEVFGKYGFEDMLLPARATAAGFTSCYYLDTPTLHRDAIKVRHLQNSIAIDAEYSALKAEHISKDKWALYYAVLKQIQNGTRSYYTETEMIDSVQATEII